EVLVLTGAVRMAPHVDDAAEARVVAVQADELRALGRCQHRLRERVPDLVERCGHRRPVERVDALAERVHAPAGTATVCVSRPDRNTVPLNAPVAWPSTTLVTPFTSTRRTPV